MDPLISVIMPTYNESKHELDESIKSVLNQTYKHFEFVIIDDNPKSVRLHHYLQNVCKKDNRIKLVFDKQNLKEGAANNGVKASKGKYIVRMDADDVAYKNRIKNQLHFLIQHHLDFVYSNFSLMDENDKLTRKKTYGNNSQTNQKAVKKIVSYGNMTVGPTFFFKRNLFNKIGGYRPINGEDFDLVARFLINGYRVGFQSAPVIIKRLRRTSITYNGLLSQYVAQRTISNYLNKYSYKKVMPINILENNWNHITDKQIYKFKCYANARYTYNDNKSLVNLLKTIMTILSSRIVFKRCLWSLLNKYQERHI